MNEPLVSIITPVYNAERFLSDTIKSVQNQTYKNWEILLIDDCSKDNSAQIIKEFQKYDNRIKYIKLKILVHQYLEMKVLETQRVVLLHL